MSRSITITPAGRLLLSPDAQTAPQLSAAMTSALEKTFAASSAEGLLCLASQAMDEPMPAALVFWREWASALANSTADPHLPVRAVAAKALGELGPAAKLAVTVVNTLRDDPYLAARDATEKGGPTRLRRMAQDLIDRGPDSWRRIARACRANA